MKATQPERDPRVTEGAMILRTRSIVVVAHVAAVINAARATAQASFRNACAGEGMDVVPVLRTIRSVATQHVEDGKRIEIARMQQLLAERD